MDGVWYHVWKRNDGYVNASTYIPGDYGTTNNQITFKVLLSTQSWEEARQRIIEERQKESIDEPE